MVVQARCAVTVGVMLNYEVVGNVAKYQWNKNILAICCGMLFVKRTQPSSCSCSDAGVASAFTNNNTFLKYKIFILLYCCRLATFRKQTFLLDHKV